MGKKSKKQKRASHYKKEMLKRGTLVRDHQGRAYVECPKTGTMFRAEDLDT